MIDQIKQVPQYESKPPEEIRSYLAEAVTIPNMRAWTQETMEKEGGLSGSEIDVLLDTLRLAGGRGSSAFQWLSTTTEGLEFGSNERQAMIDLFSSKGQWETQIPGMTARVKGLGRLTKTRWELLGGAGSVPTEISIEKALIVDKCRKDMMAILQPIAAKNTALNAWLDVLDQSNKTIAEVRAYCESLLSSGDGNP